MIMICVIRGQLHTPTDTSDAPSPITSAMPRLLCVLLAASAISDMGCDSPVRDQRNAAINNPKKVENIVGRDPSPTNINDCNDSVPPVAKPQPRLADPIPAEYSVPLKRRELNTKGYRHDANERLRKELTTSTVPFPFTDLLTLVHPHRPAGTFSSKPEITDQETVERFGLLTILHAYHSRGDSCEGVDALSKSKLVANQDAAALAMLGWLLSTCQRDEALLDWAASVPVDCQRYPEYWMAMGDLAMTNRSPESVYFYFEALRCEPNSVRAIAAMISALDLNTLHNNKETRAWLQERRKELSTIQSIVNELANPRGDPTRLVVDLAKRLGRVGRPIESLAWQELLAQQIGANPARRLQSEARLQQIRQIRRDLLLRYPSGIDEAVCDGPFQRTAAPAIPAFLASLPSPKKHIPPINEVRSAPEPSKEFVTPQFVNVAQPLGIDFQWRSGIQPIHRNFRIFEPLGGGVACLDFDRDGRLDFFFPQAGGEGQSPSPHHHDQLFRGLDAGWVNVAALSGVAGTGYAHGTTAGDWNQDGFEDLGVSQLGRNYLFINQGDGTFRPWALAPWAKGRCTLSICLADVTGDHLPDWIEANYFDDPSALDPITFDADGNATNLPNPLRFKPGRSQLLINQPNGSMVWHRLGDPPPDQPTEADFASTSMGLIVANLDEDPGNEIFISNDQRPNHLWKRNVSSAPPGSVSFREVGLLAGVALGSESKPMASMGIAVGDFNRDRKLDLHLTNFSKEWVNLYLQVSPGMFKDRCVAYQLTKDSTPMVGFGTQALDYDNNGTEDLVVANGHVEDFEKSGELFHMPTQFFVGSGRAFKRVDVAGDDSYWRGSRLGRGVATCDFNRDGRLDFVVTHVDELVAFFENQTSTAQNHFLQVELIGRTSERDAIGAEVEILINDKPILTKWRCAGDGYLVRNEPILHFGLGDQDMEVDVRVRWPDGSSDLHKNLRVNKRWMIVQGDSAAWSRTGP